MSERKCRAADVSTCREHGKVAVLAQQIEKDISQSYTAYERQFIEPETFNHEANANLHAQARLDTLAEIDAQDDNFNALLRLIHQTKKEISSSNEPHGGKHMSKLFFQFSELADRKTRAEGVRNRVQHLKDARLAYERTDEGYKKLIKEIEDLRFTLADEDNGLADWEVELQKEHMKALMARSSDAYHYRMNNR